MFRWERLFGADGFLYLAADFYPLAEHPGFFLDIDLDGDDELQYAIEESTETRWVITNYPEGW